MTGAAGAEHFALALILLLAAALRVYGIGSQSLWFDEAASVRIVRQDFGTMMGSIKDDERIPPLHYLVLHGWVRVFGHAEWSVRLPSAIAGTGAVLALFLLARRLFDARVALAAALLLAVSPFQLQYSQEARAYTLMLLTSLLSCWLFVRLLDGDEPRARLESTYVLVSAAALYSHLYAVFTLLAQVITYGVVWARVEKPALAPRRWLVTQLAIGALFLPWAPIALRWARSVGSGFWIAPMTSRDLWTPYAAYAGSLLLLLLLILLLLLGLFSHRRNGRGVTLTLCLAALPVLVPTIVSLLTKPTFTPRYGIVAPAGLFTLAACGALALRHRVAQALVLAAAVGLSLHALRTIPHKPDWAGTVRGVEGRASAGDYVVMTPRRSTYIYDYYATRRDVTRKGFDSGAIPLSVPLDTGSIPLNVPIDRGIRVWFIYPPGQYDPAEVLQRGGWTVRSSRSFRQLTVLELSDSPTPTTGASPP